MKNYIYVPSTIGAIQVYYARAKNKRLALLKLAKISNTHCADYWKVNKEMKELKDVETVLDLDDPNYEG